MDLKRHISIHSETDRALLADIQGNILKGHGRQFSANVFLNLGADPGECRKYIGALAQTCITSGLDQMEASERFRRGEDSGPFAVLGISFDGYKKLAVEQGKAPADLRYRYGMKAVRNSRPGLDPDYVLQDIPFNRWEDFYRSSIDVVLVLADDKADRLDESIAKIREQAGPICNGVHVERGSLLKRGGRTIEHFGFLDGISQPLFFSEDIEQEMSTRGGKYWNPEAPLGIVLSADFTGASSYGSYLVFRKLEQNVHGFSAAVSRLAAVTYQSEEVAAALVLGRTRDGIPLIPTQVSAVGSIPNDFQYDEDVYGLVCPYHSHIRKTNPRGDILRKYKIVNPTFDFVAFERNHRLARRGVTYGERPDLVDSQIPLPRRGVGLLFMAYTAWISSFEHRQTAMDDENFVTDEIGIDPLAGYQEKPVAQRWPTPNANMGPGVEDPNIPARSVRFQFGRYVTLKGGEYFFTPSVPYLKNLPRQGR